MVVPIRSQKLYLATVLPVSFAAILVCHNSQADSTESRAAIGMTALPELVNVAIPTPAPRVGLATTMGYGYIEALGPQSGANHRFIGSLAASYSPVAWAGVALRVDGRYDRHPSDAMGSDYTAVGDPRLTLRFRTEISDALHLGVEGQLWAPGEDAPSLRLDALSPESRALFAWVSPTTTLAVHAGYRLDRTANTLEMSRSPRFGDLLSSGVSDFDAILVGFGIRRQIGKVIAVADLAADIQVGKNAPGFTTSPINLSLGARLPFSEAMALEAVAQVSPSGRPNLTESRVRIIPRACALVGLRVAFDEALGKKDEPPLAKPPARPRPRRPPIAEPPPAIPIPLPVATASVKGRVTDEGGNPIPDVRVVLETEGSPAKELHTDGEGLFEFGDLPYGEYTVRTQTPGYDKTDKSLSVSADAVDNLELTLYPALPAGQVRGLVQSFGGKPLQAVLRISDGGIEVATKQDGTFSVDVPPGVHTVEISAEGYQTQRKRIRVENRGVTVINADLRRKP